MSIGDFFSPGDSVRHVNQFLLYVEIPLEGDLLLIQRDREYTISPGSVGLLHQDEDSTLETGKSGFCRKLSMGFAWTALLNRSPKDYCRNLRMEKAKALLFQSTFPVKEIAALCGYKDPFNITNAFRHSAGISPREYRKQNLKHPDSSQSAFLV